MHKIIPYQWRWRWHFIKAQSTQISSSFQRVISQCQRQWLMWTVSGECNRKSKRLALFSSPSRRGKLEALTVQIHRWIKREDLGAVQVLHNTTKEGGGVCCYLLKFVRTVQHGHRLCKLAGELIDTQAVKKHTKLGDQIHSFKMMMWCHQDDFSRWLTLIRTLSHSTLEELFQVSFILEQRACITKCPYSENTLELPFTLPFKLWNKCKRLNSLY